METHKRIGIDARILQEEYFSGIPEYAYNVIKNMVKDNPEYRFVLFFNSFRNIKNNIPKEITENCECKFFRFPNKILEWTWRIIPLPKIDKILKVDYFFSPHFYFIPLSKKVKKTITIHDISFEKNKRFFSLRKNIWHKQMNPKKTLKYFNKIISVSESTKNDLVEIYKIPDKKIKIIPNSYDFEIKNHNLHDENSVLKKFDIQKDQYFLFLGTIEPRKNVSMAIESFLSSKTDKKLVIAGKSGWLYKEEIKKAKQHKDRIAITGYITDQEKDVLLKNCFTFLFPALYEGFGIPVIEAKSYGKPVITSTSSSLPEVIGEKSIMVNPHNISYNKVAIETTLNSDNYNIFSSTTEPKQLTWNEVARKTFQHLIS